MKILVVVMTMMMMWEFCTLVSITLYTKIWDTCLSIIICTNFYLAFCYFVRKKIKLHLYNLNIENYCTYYASLIFYNITGSKFQFLNLYHIFRQQTGNIQYQTLKYPLISIRIRPKISVKALCQCNKNHTTGSEPSIQYVRTKHYSQKRYVSIIFHRDNYAYFLSTWGQYYGLKM